VDILGGCAVGGWDGRWVVDEDGLKGSMGNKD
jgi:hypothetical protein